MDRHAPDIMEKGIGDGDILDHSTNRGMGKGERTWLFAREYGLCVGRVCATLPMDDGTDEKTHFGV
jgi:hypothetical protein